MDTVLVTGCAGFIGSHFCNLLLKEGYAVCGIDNFDPFYPRSVKEENLAALQNYPHFKFYEKDITEGLEDLPLANISTVVHLAAKAGVRPSIDDPAGYIHTNITGTQRLHDFIRDRQIKKFIFASSSSVYGNNKKIPFNEDDSVDQPISPYAYTKKAGELMNFALHHLYNVDVVNLRFFTVYGPGQRPDLAIHKFVKQISADEQLMLFGDGNTARDYTYIDDIMSGIYKAMQYCENHSPVYEIFNLGNNKPIKLKDLATAIYHAMNKKPNVKFESMQPGDVEITYADISKAKKLLGYEPTTDFTKGLQNFIEWHENKKMRRAH